VIAKEGKTQRGLRLAELLAPVSLATDLAHDVPAESALRDSLLAVELEDTTPAPIESSGISRSREVMRGHSSTMVRDREAPGSNPVPASRRLSPER